MVSFNRVIQVRTWFVRAIASQRIVIPVYLGMSAKGGHGDVHVRVLLLPDCFFVKHLICRGPCSFAADPDPFRVRSRHCVHLLAMPDCYVDALA